MLKYKQIELLEERIKELEGDVQRLMIQLEVEKQQANDDITWWTNRYNAVEGIKNKLDKENQMLFEENFELRQKIDKTIHRIQLLQMDGEVTIKDLGLIVRNLKGDSNE